MSWEATGHTNYDTSTSSTRLQPGNDYIGGASPSSPPSVGASPSEDRSSIPRFPQVKLRLKFGSNQDSSTPRMELLSGYDSGSNGESTNPAPSRFSDMDPQAVRAQYTGETLHRDDPEDQQSTEGEEHRGVQPKSEMAVLSDANEDDDEPASGRTKDSSPPAKRETRKRNSDAKHSGGSSAKKEKTKRGKGGGGGGSKKKKEEEEEGEEGGEDDEESVTEEVFEVNKILDHQLNGGKRWFKVSWLGYTEEHDSWEPEKNLGSAKLAIQEYMKKHGDKPATSAKKGRGRPKGSAASPKKDKKKRASLPGELSDESSAPEDDKDDKDDDDFEVEGGGRRGGSKSRRSKTKGEVKSFPSKTTTTPRQVKIKRVHLATRQNWLNDSSESDSSDDESKKDRKEDKKKKHQDEETDDDKKYKPKREWQERDSHNKVEEERSSKRKTGGKVDVAPVVKESNGSSSRASSSRTIEGIFRNSKGEVMVCMTERGKQDVVPLQEAHESSGWNLLQYLVDRCVFEH